MKELDKIAGKRLPYKEDNDYVAQLVARSADMAVSSVKISHKRNVVVKWGRIIISAAAVLIFGLLFFSKLNDESEYDKYQNSMTLSEVLDSMSDEKLMCVSYYEIEDIPEYE